MDKANVPEEDFGATVHKYENFVDDVLRKDLDAAVKAMDKTYLAYGETKKLRRNLSLLKKSNTTTARSLVNLGCDIFAEAEIPDTSMAYVETAFGFYLKLTIEEALDFLEKKEAFLDRRLAYWREKYAYLKAQLCLFVEALSTVIEPQRSL